MSYDRVKFDLSARRAKLLKMRSTRDWPPHSSIRLILFFSLFCSPIGSAELNAEPHSSLSLSPKAKKIKHTPRHVITAQQTLLMLNSSAEALRPTLLDARDLWPFYYWSHVSNALHTPWRHFTVGRRSGLLVTIDQLEQKLRALGITEDRPVVIYGDWERGWGEEARMLWLLEYLGHRNVYVVEGGWTALKESGAPTTWGRPALSSPSTWEVKPDPTRRALASQVAALVTEGQLSIDARSLKEFEGETPYGSSYGGHLKGSVHLPWKTLLTHDHKLKSPEELKAIFIDLGVSEDQPIITYCTGGVRSAFVYLALREAGFDEAMNYDGSWWEWTELYTAEAKLLSPRKK